MLVIILLSAFTFKSDNTEVQMVNNIVVQFEGINGNGNNLWLDNFSIGTRYNDDLAVSSLNIDDCNYLLPGVPSTTFSPVVTVFNAGRNSSAATTITMTGNSYNSTKSVPAITSGGTQQVTFDPITFNLSAAQNVKVYLNYSTDQNKFNDTLAQSCVYYPGVKRKVLFEAFTNASCGPCASQNPALDAFVQQRFDTIIAIKYHTWWPGPTDPMYTINIPQARVRTIYNSISAVPTLQIDGVLQQVSGYTTLSNLLNPYNNRLAKASPIAISVTDTRLTGDTIKATVNYQVLSPLSPNANLKLKLSAIERKITYATAPGTNGETIFYDVFRRMFPSTDGISINTTPGNYSYVFKYKRESAWIDSMIYSAVFIQNETTKEVINCAKARNYYADENIKYAQNSENDEVTNFSLNNNYYPSNVTGGIVVETMEGVFPPPGWNLINADTNHTFWQYIYAAVNGPSFAGTKSIRINYYSYAENIGTSDILRSKIYNDVNPNDSIKFDWAYANRPGYSDRLKVKVSTDGGATFPYTIFDREGATLATAGSSTSSFVPTSGQWGTFGARFGSLTGVTTIENGIPNKYSLNQNYPNPFNPLTTISFGIPVRGLVTLKVYDILGKEIADLLNDEKQAGTYKINFEASNLPSGIYFYKIEVNGFNEVRKMILLK